MDAMEDRTLGIQSARERWINRLAALSVFLFVLVIYIRTMAVSVSFWDCGEFIACAHVLGIPHPPGAPLFGLLSRLFNLLPLFETVARRVNFLSALTGALSAGMLYLVVERISRSWFSEGLSWRGRLLGMIGGITAGLWMAFSDTYWSNTIEAEVYASATFLMVLVVWLSLKWREAHAEGRGDHLLLMLVYIMFLGIAVHLTVFLISPAVFLFVVLNDRDRLYDWRFWLVAVAMSMVVVSLGDPFLVAISIALIVSVLGMTMGNEANRRRWRFCFWMVLLAFLGYSIQAFIPIRSMLDPVIDENNPDNWARFMAYLERKQYGQTSMLEGMFHRKGSWGNQFGIHPRMGYWGFFRQGWAPVSWWPLVLGIGLAGVVIGWFRERRRWIYLITLLLLCTVLIVFWMNFSDGTRGVQLEVRDRDYFFTPTYIAFSLWMGLGVSGLLWLVLRKLKGAAGKALFWLLAAAMLIAPIGTLAYNYHRHDRSRNWIARDYAYNLLGSCRPDAIIFTNGDNDTFPLWYLQEVEGARKDVRVVNLSLLNTGWYIKQLHNMEPRVPTGYTDDQADALMPIRWPEDREIDLGGFPLTLKSGQILRVQDRAVLNIIRTNRWQRPIYFAITVSPDNKLGLDQHLKMEGMALRLVTEEGPNMIDLDRSQALIMEHYSFRGLNDPRVYKDDNTIKLLTNYAASFAAVGQAFCNLGRFAEARKVLEKGVQVLYPFWGIYQVLARAYDGLGEVDLAIEAGQRAVELAGEEERPMVYTNLLPIYRKHGRIEDLVAFVENRLMNDPEEFSAYWALFRIYHTTGKVQQAAGALERWLSVHPEDERTREFLTDYRRRMITSGETPGEDE
jgi:tetratricopeptide (TPR) repeat protein